MHTMFSRHTMSRLSRRISRALVLAGAAMSMTEGLVAEDAHRLYEMRIYFAPEGKLDALHSRFRDHTCELFAKHGMTNVGYFVPEGANPERKLVYFLSYPDRPAREQAWKGFLADPDWMQAHAQSERDGKLVERIESRFLKETDYSPAFSPASRASGPKADRTFELRTYIATPGNLPSLNARFRDHTCKLFEKHGMTNVIYWNLADKEPHADRMLVYLLAHESRDAASRSFAAFRQDPDWIAARTESERLAGGSLTAADGGVVSEFLVATDYSPLR